MTNKEKFEYYMKIFNSKNLSEKIDMYEEYCDSKQYYFPIEGVKDAMLINILRCLDKGQINYKENV